MVCYLLLEITERELADRILKAIRIRYSLSACYVHHGRIIGLENKMAELEEQRMIDGKDRDD